MSKIFRSRRVALALTGLVLAAALVSGAFAARPIENKTSKIQADWSRGIRVGSSPWNQPPAIAAAADGRQIHLAWPDNRSAGMGVQYLQLDDHAQRVTEQWWGVQGAPRAVRLMVDEHGRPHLFVLARMPGEQATRLIHCLPVADGTRPASMQAVSPADVEVQSYAVTAGPSGILQVMWTAEPASEARGLYYTRLNSEGQIITSQRLNERPALDVSAQVDHKGDIHVVWEETLGAKLWQVLYAVFSQGNLEPTEGVAIDQADTVAVVGLDRQRVYILWGAEIKGGMFAGMGFTRYVSFPFGDPQTRASAGLHIPANGRPEYRSYQGVYGFKTLASASASADELTDLIHSPAPLAGQRDQMAVVTVAAMSFGIDRRVLPTLVILEDGQVVGYQVIAYNYGFNSRPALAADGAGNLYAAWLTGSTGAGFGVYYAATTAAARASLDRADLTDVLVGAATLVWQMLGGLSLLPFFPLIILPALIVAVGYSVFGGGETLDNRRAWLALIIGCLAYWLTKELVLGSVLAEPVIGRQLSGWARTALVWAIQLVIAAVAAGVAARQIISKRTDSVFWSTLIFIICDMLLTMLMAGPTLALRG